MNQSTERDDQGNQEHELEKLSMYTNSNEYLLSHFNTLGKNCLFSKLNNFKES